MDVHRGSDKNVPISVFAMKRKVFHPSPGGAHARQDRYHPQSSAEEGLERSEGRDSLIRPSESDRITRPPSAAELGCPGIGIAVIAMVRIAESAAAAAAAGGKEKENGFTASMPRSARAAETPEPAGV